MWILTSEYNEYDQQGEYFVAAFLNKPTKSQLVKALKDDGYAYGLIDSYADALLETGGGRKDAEYCWYNLSEYVEYSK